MRQSVFTQQKSRYKFALLLVISSLMAISINSKVFNNANEESSINGRGSKQISDINMLLPISGCPDCRKVVYQISAINGCYQWEVSHTNYVSLKPIYSRVNSQCSNIAEISSISTKPTKSLIWITARDLHSGQVLRCEVKIGVVQKLEIQTHLRQFYVDEYEHLHIAAYDEEGNIFNSLEGFRFEWSIDHGNDFVKIVSMKEAAHVSSEFSQEMEFSKMHSDVLFLKGVKSGIASISVKLMEPGYEELSPAFVPIVITEPFVIIPQSTVYLLPTSKFQFQLAKVSLSNNEMLFTPIRIPSKQYQWNVDIDEKGDIGEDGVFISKDREGFVNVFVVDQYIANNTAESSVKVVFPQLLDIEIIDVTDQMLDSKTLLTDDLTSPYYQQMNISSWDNNWILVEGHYYLLKVFLFDRDKNSIFLTENCIFKNHIDHEHFDVIKSNKIHSEFIVRAKKTTVKNQKLIITSILEDIKSAAPYHKYHVDQHRLRSEKDVQITYPVKINHPTDLILLPLLKYMDESRNGEYWQATARGGSGYYQWTIQDARVSTASGSGLLRSKEIGHTILTVKDTLNNRNLHNIKVEVIPIQQLVWLEDHLEIKKGTEEGVLNVIALDKQGRKFTNCTGINAMFELKGEGILQPVQTSNDYTDLKEYVNNNKDLMFIRYRFDQNPNAVTLQDITINEIITSEKEELLLHNNFGICNQQKYVGVAEGLARIKSIYTNQVSVGSTQLIETVFAEVAAYESLNTRNPSYINFFSDLYSKTPIQSEDFSFHKFYINNTFVLAFGSSLVWQIQGGTNFWKDIPQKYQVSHSTHVLNHDDHLDQKALAIDKISEDTTQFRYAMSCLKPNIRHGVSHSHRYRVALRQQNMLSRHLLRPAVHQIGIDVHCEPPANVKMHWAQESKNINPVQYKNLPKYRTLNGEKQHFVLVNSNHFLRSLMFDSQTYVFYNYSSIYTEVQSSNEHMLKALPFRETYDLTVADNTYDLRIINVYNLTGTVYLNAIAKGYIRYYLNKDYSSYYSGEIEALGVNHEVKDRMRIEIVKNVDIQPKYKSIYIAKDNSYQFKIIHGSGHFSVSINNTEVADKHYIDGDRVVTIYPKKDGPIEIRVEDVEIPDSVVAISELLISDIAKLELDAPGTLIEEGSSMDLNVTAFDQYGQEFDLDQYQHMKFHIEIEITQQRGKGLIAESDNADNRKFIARGYDPGNYQVIAVSLKFKPTTSYYRQDQVAIERQRVTSEVLKIEVFPLLEIHPSTLLLTPLMRYTLQIVGGPTRASSSQSYHGGSVEIKFDVEDKNIATVDTFREVVGQEVGDTKLYYEIIQVKSIKSGIMKRSIVSKKTLLIRVRLVTSIDIPYNNQRTVSGGSMIKMIGILKYNQETFTHGIAPISYNWNCSNPNVLSMNFPSKSDITSTNALTSTLVMVSKKIRDNEANTNQVFLSQFNSSTVYSTGQKQGEALVYLQLAIEYPDKYRYEKNWFSTRIMLRVKEKLTVDVPEFINNPEQQTHLYLMPPNTYSKIETNRRTRLRLGYSQQSVYDYSTNSYQYKDTQTPIISLVNDEGIKTSDKYGKVTVIIEENQAFSDSVVMLNILITDIYTLTTKDVYQTLSFPLGSSMTIPIKHQNEQGHIFAHNIEGIEVGIELSHPRVVSAQLDEYNSTILMKAEGSGECNVVVYLVKQPEIYDIFRVRVSSVVKPPSPVQLHVGGEVKFKIMDNQEYSTGRSEGGIIWSSNNPAVIDINQKSGEARALQEGRAEILLSNHITAASIIQVSKVKSAQIDENSRKNLVINTDESHGEVRIRIKLFLHDQIEELTPTIQFDGITLVKQNVGLLCESDHPNLIETRAEVNELEGFFCIINFKSYNAKTIPKGSTIMVTTYAPNPHDPKNTLYQEKILTFEISYVSKIKVESYYRNGVGLSKDHRTASLKIFSNTQFQVLAENQNEQDKGYDLLKFKVNRTSAESTEYLLTVTVPQEVTHDFVSNLILVHPTTGSRTVIPVQFEGKATSGYGATHRRRGEDEEEGESILEGIANYFRPSDVSGKAGETTTKRERKEDETNYFFNYFLMPILLLVLTFFVLVNIFKIDPIQMISDVFDGRNPFRQRQQIGGRNIAQMRDRDRLQQQQSDIRSSNIARNLFPSAQSSFMNQQQPQRSSSQYMQSMQSPAVGGGGGYNRPPSSLGLNKFQYSGDSGKKQDYNNSSIYNNSGWQ